MLKKKIVYVVHCVDTEGPLYESLSAKFERIKEVFNVNIKHCTEFFENILKEKLKLNFFYIHFPIK